MADNDDDQSPITRREFLQELATLAGAGAGAAAGGALGYGIAREGSPKYDEDEIPDAASKLARERLAEKGLPLEEFYSEYDKAKHELAKERDPMGVPATIATTVGGVAAGLVVGGKAASGVSDRILDKTEEDRRRDEEYRRRDEAFKRKENIIKHSKIEAKEKRFQERQKAHRAKKSSVETERGRG